MIEGQKGIPIDVATKIVLSDRIKEGDQCLDSKCRQELRLIMYRNQLFLECPAHIHVSREASEDEKAEFSQKPEQETYPF